MKHLKWFLYAFLGYILGSLTTPTEVRAQAISATPDQTDSVRVSLLTCGPGKLAYELYGHTAIRIEGHPFTFNSREGDEIVFNDVAANWGLFSFKQPYFILRFIFGQTDYHMGIAPMEDFMDEYREEGRWVHQQTLNLQPDEKRRIIEAIEENHKPENRTYRYNFFYDNCTTRADKMITKQLDVVNTDDLVYDTTPTTYREAIHAYNARHRWARLGNDLLLGWKADRPITIGQSLFLPINLMHFYGQATLHKGDTVRTICTAETTILEGIDESHTEFLSPLNVALLLLLSTLLVVQYELRRRKLLWPFDLALLLFVGLGGLILTAMVFSAHPTVQQNLQILLLNPFALLCLYPAVRNECKSRSHWFWKVYTVCIILFLLGNLLQDYAEGMNVLALCLLLRCYMNTKNR